MNVLILEVCRSPELMKVTTPMILTHFFIEEGIEYKIISNDGIWSESTILTKNIFKKLINETECGIIHLSMHGNNQNLALRWSGDMNLENRVVVDALNASDIEEMSSWEEKLIISGACATAKLAPSFLKVGAKGVVAPENIIIWTNLGHFFRLLYGSLNSGKNIETALSLAISNFPELESYRYFK